MKSMLSTFVRLAVSIANGFVPFAFVASTMFMAVSAQAADERQERRVRVDFTSKPEGADVIIDGFKHGTTPLSLVDLRPGEHHVRFELDGYEPHDEFFTISSVEDGRRVMLCNAELTSVKGLLLITTDPEGCTVTHQDGTSFGETPRLITVLDTKRTHRFKLQKGGYNDKTIEVKFNGRTPLVKHENLVLDSGTIKVTSEPEGVSVMKNDVSVGVTPLELSRIPKGRVTLEFSLDGYLTQKRELKISPGDMIELDIKMVGKPGSLYLESIPADARFYVNNSPYGKGPIEKQEIEPGTYSIRAEKEGYDSVTKTVRIGLGQSVKEEFRLKSIMGRLEVRTEPSGAQIFVDGSPKGITRPMPGVSELLTSDVLSVEDLKQGEVTLVVKKPGYADEIRHPEIENERTKEIKVKLKKIFKPNYRIVTSTGSYDVFFDPSDDKGNYIEAEYRLGAKRPFMKADIVKLIPLD